MMGRSGLTDEQPIDGRGSPRVLAAVVLALAVGSAAVLVLSNEAKAVPRPDETQPGKGRADKPRRNRSRESTREPKEQAKDGDGTR